MAVSMDNLGLLKERITVFRQRGFISGTESASLKIRESTSGRVKHVEHTVLLFKVVKN